MMKKIIFVAICLALATVSACSAKDKKVRPENLPTTIRQFIKSTFPQLSITAVTQEVDDKDYNVSLSDGTKVEFGKDNQWSEICSKKAPIPTGLIPQGVLSYVNHQYPRATIVRIERCALGYEVELNNHKHFQLDKKFQRTKFKDVD